MSKIILFNKPWGVLSQFRDSAQRQTLSSWIDAPDFYPAGRLDQDSEGLLLLCRDGALQQRIASPRFKLPKTYLVQVEGQIDEPALARLRSGVDLNDGVTLAARAAHIPEPRLWAREVPIRTRASIPTSWLRLTLTEGRNRQVRRMTAAVGLPTLRLVRWQIGPWTLDGLACGAWRIEDVHLPAPTRDRTAGTRGRAKATSL